jgi:hypothetical protein
MQPGYFKGCVYIQSFNQILVPGGHLLDQSRFRVAYGGWWFVLDPGGEKSVRNAWEAFTESQAWEFPKVVDASFRPDLPPGHIYDRHGVSAVNIYYPANIPRKKGDPSPFLRHFRKLVPDDQDAAILMAYMAACVQHPGKKFQWCPLIQGTEGNGKTLLSRAVAEAIGAKYCYFPRAHQLESEFNGWVANKIFIGIEDIYIGEHKQQLMETLKPLITGEVQEVRVMRTDGYCTEVCCNFILNSNHKDALRKTSNDRRYAPFFTPQQSRADLVRDGMVGDYFPQLYDWLRTEGYAIVAEYLHTYDIPDELNPAVGCQYAPDTTSTADAIASSLGTIEQALLERVAEEAPGFSGGYISSVAVQQLLQQLGRRLPVNKRRQLLQQLGYDHHPALPGGRLTAPSEVDGGKRPVLFVRDAPADMSATEVLADYLAAQRGNPFVRRHGT